MAQAPSPLKLGKPVASPSVPKTEIEQLIDTFGSWQGSTWEWDPSKLFEDTDWQQKYGRHPQPLATGCTSSVYKGWIKDSPEQFVAIKILRFESSHSRMSEALTELSRGALRDAAAEAGGGGGGGGREGAPAATAFGAAGDGGAYSWYALLNKGCHEVAALRCAALINKRVREAGGVPRLHDLLSAHCLGGTPSGMPRAPLVIVTRFASGGDLTAALWRENVRVMDAAPLLREAFLGVADLHGAGLIHNDLKPGNVLVQRDAAGALRAVVSDLGSVRLPGLPVASLKGEGPFEVYGGTEEYLAPEVDAEVPGGPKRDVFALGVLLAAVFTGGPPAVELAIAQDPAYGPVDCRNLDSYPTQYHPPNHTAWSNAHRNEALWGTTVGDLWAHHPPETGLRELLEKMLEAEETHRATLEEALAHDWWDCALKDHRMLAVEAVGSAALLSTAGDGRRTPVGDGGGGGGSGGGASFRGGSGFAMTPRDESPHPAGSGALTPSRGIPAVLLPGSPRPQLLAASPGAASRPQRLTLLFGRACRSRSTSEEAARLHGAFKWRHNLYRLRVTLDAVAAQAEGRVGAFASDTLNDEGAPSRCSPKTGTYYCGRRGAGAAFFWNRCESCANDGGACGKVTKNGVLGCECSSCHRLTVLAAAAGGDAGNARRSAHWPGTFRLCTFPAATAIARAGAHHAANQLRSKRPRSPEKNAAGRAVKEHGGHFYCGAEVGPAGLWVGWLPGWTPGGEVRCRPSQGANCAECHVVDVTNLRGAVGCALLPALPPAQQHTPLPLAPGTLVKAPPRSHGDGFLGTVVERREDRVGGGKVLVRVLRRGGGVLAAFPARGGAGAGGRAAAPPPLPLPWMSSSMQEEKRDEERWMDEQELVRADLLPPPVVLVGPRRGGGGESRGRGGGGATAATTAGELEQQGEALAHKVRSTFGKITQIAQTKGVTKEQLGALLKEVGLTGARYNHSALFDLLDQEDSGQVDLREILLGLAHLVSFRASEHTLLSLLFFAFDLDGDGTLSKEELGELLAAFGAPPAAVEAVERARRHGLDLHSQLCSFARYAVALFDKMDVDHDGQVTLTEFTRHVTRDPVMRALWVERDEAGAISLLVALSSDAERGLQELRVALRAKEARVLSLERDIADLEEKKQALLAERELLKLRAAREIERLPAHGAGSRCSGCGCSPVRGALWRCEPCAFSLCGRCREDGALAREWQVRCGRGHVFARWSGGGAPPAAVSLGAWAWEGMSKLLSPGRTVCNGTLCGDDSCEGAVEWGCGVCAAYRCGVCFVAERKQELEGREEEVLASESLLVRALSKNALCPQQHELVSIAPPRD